MAQNTPQGPIYTLILTWAKKFTKKISPQTKSFFWTWLTPSLAEIEILDATEAQKPKIVNFDRKKAFEGQN